MDKFFSFLFFKETDGFIILSLPSSPEYKPFYMFSVQTVLKKNSMSVYQMEKEGAANAQNWETGDVSSVPSSIVNSHVDLGQVYSLVCVCLPVCHENTNLTI